ncbi:MAG: signal peptidase I [Mycobacterium leprae]
MNPTGGETPLEQQPAKRKRSEAREWLETILIALAVALVIRGYIAQTYVVDGDSMVPSLHNGERFLVNKLVYRFRLPKPGEIVVLHDPAAPTKQLVKRVVALPGETVQIKHQVLYVNGQPISENYINKAYPIADFPLTTVPPGTVYVMGDNRGRSMDSRSIGPILLSKIEGKGVFMLWPLDRFGKGPLDQPRIEDPSLVTK